MRAQIEKRDIAVRPCMGLLFGKLWVGVMQTMDDSLEALVP